MKKILIIAVIAIIGLCCTTTSKAQNKGKAYDYVEVLYFHGKQRCATCKAVGLYSKEVVYTDLAQFSKNKKVRYKEVDFSTPQGEKIADRYKVNFSGLVLSRRKSGKETFEDITDFAFRYARTDTPRFKEELKAMINKKLK